MIKKTLALMLITVCFTITGCSVLSDSGKDLKNVTSTSIEESIISKANIEEKIIVDRDNIKITAKSINYDGLLGPEIKLLIENNSTENITVQARDFSINGIMVNPTFSADVVAGKKANDSISIYTSELETAKITTIKDIEFGINVFNSDSWDDIFTKTDIELQTDANSYVQAYNTAGTLVASQNDIKIYVLKLDDEDSFWGADIYVYIENNSAQDITIQATDVSINGFMVDPTFSADVTAGKKAYDSITFFESDLEDNSIEDITEIELKFTAFNEKSWDDIFKTQSVKVNF